MRSLLLLFAFASAAPAVELKQVISREHPAFNIEKCQLTIGRDGKVYLFSSDYVLRIDRDGSGKRGAKVTYALMGAAANKEGTIATANAHFDHSVHMVGADFNEFGKVSDFLVNDKVEWQAPCDIQAGEKDFYALDQNRNRIVRVGVPDQLVTTYSLAGLGDDLTRKLAHFRVWEAGSRFYIWRPPATSLPSASTASSPGPSRPGRWAIRGTAGRVASTSMTRAGFTWSPPRLTRCESSTPKVSRPAPSSLTSGRAKAASLISVSGATTW
ncbi:MAG: hypothetical protein U0793_16660 [Gemmataceae bacterium]